MTTATGGAGLELVDLRAVRPARSRLRIVGGSGRLHWWHGRLVLGATLAGAMVGALLGVVQGYLAVGLAPIALLEAYGAAAGFGASVGLVLGLALSVLIGLADRYLLPQSVPNRRVWVRYRRDSAA